MSSHFRCDRRDCFGYQNGWCEPLIEKTTKQPCPFFKTQEQLDKENEGYTKRKNR